MKFLVLSRIHHLLPFAYRLELEGHTVEPVVSVAAFQAAWRGKLQSEVRRVERGRLDPEWLKERIAQAKAEDEVVLTDDWRLRDQLQEAGVTRLFATVHSEVEPVNPIRFGGWFDGEKLSLHHGLLVDRGAWVGGMGPAIDGAVTLTRIDAADTIELVDALAGPTLSQLKSVGFRGLVQVDLNFLTQDGDPEVTGFAAGWPLVHTHAFLSELEDFSGLLTQQSALRLPRKFVTALPVSRPPWPTRKARFRFDLAPIDGLTQAQMGRMFWHDVQVHPEEKRLTTAGLDGLVGVARGAADTNELALARALEVALRIQLPEKQFRADAGRRVQGVLSELEQRFGILL